MGKRKPVVAVLGDCHVRYRGRARAKQEGGQLAVVVKADGAVSLLSLDSGVRPQFYNPAGSTVVRRQGARVHVRSESEDGEVLVVTGRPAFLHEIEDPDNVPRPPRTRVGGTERDVVAWIRDNPGVLGYEGGSPSEEVASVGGRVDLQFDDIVVEAKVKADVRTFDQALRYLRDPAVSGVKIACLGASSNLVELCQDDERIELIIFDEDDFRGYVEREQG